MMFSRAILLVAAIVTPSATETVTNHPGSHAATHPESKAQKSLDLLNKRVAAGRVAVQKALNDLKAHNSRLTKVHRNSTELDALALSIVHSVTPELNPSQRKALEHDFEHHVDAMKKVNTTQDGAAHDIAVLRRAAHLSAEKLHHADRADAHALRQAFQSARSSELKRTKDLAKAVKKGMDDMGSATTLELAEKRAGYSERQYDHDEDALGDEQDEYANRAGDLHDRTDDLIDDLYSKVQPRVEVHVHSLNEDARAQRQHQQEALRAARDALQLKGSLDNVEKKLNRLEHNSGSALEDLASTEYQATSALCTVFVAAFAAGALVSFLIKWRSERQSIRQPELLA